MRHGSLFSGIGGFELAAEWMGWENTFHCEFNEFGSKVLNHYWPESKHYGDITKSDFSEFRDTIDILTGGFPCQPYSAAGKRKGKDDARHLWPEMLRVIREVRPRYIVGENVYGLVTWNGGLVFDEVCTDLEAEGYAVWPIVIPAAAVNAPHRRDRVWFVAYRDLHGCNKCNCDNEKLSSERRLDAFGNFKQSFSDGLTTDAPSVGLCQHSSRKEPQFATYRTRNGICEQVTTDAISERYKPSEAVGKMAGQRFRRIYQQRQYWEAFPTQSPVCSGDDGLPSELDGITFSKWRNESIKAYGNAIVPQVVYQIFKAIEDHDHRAMA